MATDQASAFPALKDQQYMNLTTFRRNGVAVTTPVWFAQEGDRLFVTTEANAGKVKRIRNTGRVQVGPCDARGKSLGPVIDAQARVLPAEEHAHANGLINLKYGLIKTGFDLFARLIGRGQNRTFIEIRPNEA